jgi:hypothetical protein
VTAPLPGHEKEFNEWYDNVHVPEVLRMPGVVAAQRYALAGAGDGDRSRYLAVYELETDDLAATLAAIDVAGQTLTFSDAMDLGVGAVDTYEVLGGRRTVGDSDDDAHKAGA